MSSRALPRHVAIIMDGNGRWARQRGLPRLEGHRRGAHAVREIVRASREMGLGALTLYAFSAQNWARPLEEVQGLMLLLRDYVIEERAEIMDNGIRLTTIGNTSRLPEFVQNPLAALMADSAGNRDMVLCLALSYGGRESITEAVRKLCAQVQAGTVTADEIDEERLAAVFQTSSLPPLDLVIRTSGEERISNFLLWESAQAEFRTTSTLWPDFSKQELLSILAQYHPSRASHP